MDIKGGATSKSVDVVLRSATDNSEMTGKVAADLTATYWRQGAAPVAITLADLAAITTAFTEGGVKEAEATLMKGTYRLDLPNAALAAGADWVQLEVFTSGSRVWKERFPLPTVIAADVFTQGASVITLLTNPAGFKKNTAVANFPFEMVDVLTGAPKTGLTVLVERRLDAGAFAPTTNTATEVGGGAYTINLTAADMNGDTVMLRFTAAGARQRSVTILTEP